MSDRDLLADASDRDRRDALLLQKYLDGELSGGEHAEFERWVDADEQHRSLLVSISLQKALAPRIFSQGDAEQLAVSSEPLASSEETHSLPLNEDIGKEVEIPARPMSLLNRASRHPKGPAIAVAVAVMVMMLGAMAITPMKEWMAGGEKKGGEIELERKEVEFVARLSSWQNDVWLEGSRPPLDDPRLKVGRRLVIESGLIEITYLTGTRVVIEGPAEFVVATEPAEGIARARSAADRSGRGEAGRGSLSRSREGEGGSQSGKRKAESRQWDNNSGYLKFGKLVARVEGENAQGFYVDTPFARVEDHGTEFGIEVRRSGAADVVVLDGKVDLVATAGSARGDRIRLVADQGASIESNGGAIARMNNVEPHILADYRRRIRYAVDPRSDLAGRRNVAAATNGARVSDASEPYKGSAGPEVVIDQRELREPDAAFKFASSDAWHSNRVAGVFWEVEFAEACLLDEVEIQGRVDYGPEDEYSRHRGLEIELFDEDHQRVWSYVESQGTTFDKISTKDHRPASFGRLSFGANGLGLKAEQRRAKYMRITQTKNDYLALAEVRVFAFINEESSKTESRAE